MYDGEPDGLNSLNIHFVPIELMPAHEETMSVNDDQRTSRPLSSHSMFEIFGMINYTIGKPKCSCSKR